MKHLHLQGIAEMEIRLIQINSVKNRVYSAVWSYFTISRCSKKPRLLLRQTQAVARLLLLFFGLQTYTSTRQTPSPADVIHASSCDTLSCAEPSRLDYYNELLEGLSNEQISRFHQAHNSTSRLVNQPCSLALLNTNIGCHARMTLVYVYIVFSVIV